MAPKFDIPDGASLARALESHAGALSRAAVCVRERIGLDPGDQASEGSRALAEDLSARANLFAALLHKMRRAGLLAEDDLGARVILVRRLRREGDEAYFMAGRMGASNRAGADDLKDWRYLGPEASDERWQMVSEVAAQVADAAAATSASGFPATTVGDWL